MKKFKQPWHERLRRKLFGFTQGPRPVIRSILAKEDDSKARSLGHAMHQLGYTSGDRFVVLLERDYDRLREVAKRKHSGMPFSMIYWMMDREFMEGFQK